MHVLCRLAEKPIAALIAVGSGAFGASKEEMKERFIDHFWRRGLANAIKGLGYFGVSKPFIPGGTFSGGLEHNLQLQPKVQAILCRCWIQFTE